MKLATGCYHVSGGIMNQSSAEEYCHSIGGHLVVIEDQYEQTAIAHYLDSILKGMFS